MVLPAELHAREECIFVQAESGPDRGALGRKDGGQEGAPRKGGGAEDRTPLDGKGRTRGGGEVTEEKEERPERGRG